VLVLGLVSLLTDVSGEMVASTLPQFLAVELAVAAAFIGVVEGIADLVSNILKAVFGAVSDQLRKRKPIIALGYAISAVTRPCFAAASSATDVLLLRSVDRVGKGARTAPRDALIASAAGDALGKSFGIHRALDTAGALIGPLIAIPLLSLFGFRTLYLLTLLPGGVALTLLLAFVHEPPMEVKQRLPPSALLQRPVLKILLITIGLSLGHLSALFLIARAFELGFGVLSPIGFYVLFNAIYALSSAPAGVLADRIGINRVLAIGISWAALSYVTLVFAAANPLVLVPLAFVLFGLSYGFCEGQLRAFAASRAPEEAIGTSIGAYYLGAGIASFTANTIASTLWIYLSPQIALTYATAAAIFGVLVALTA